MNILSVQSWVTYGHVGNAAALFPLQRLGAEVWTINTVQFSNHPGYGSHTGRLAGGDAVAELIDGLAARGLLERTDAVLSGYLGDAASGRALLDGVARIRALRPDMVFCCDPVLGDRGPGLYVPADLAALLRDEAVGQADILTPNRFELAFLLGDAAQAAPAATGPVQAPAVQAAVQVAALQARMRQDGPGLVLITSAETEATAPGEIDLLLATREGAHRIVTPRLPLETNGAGDLTAALFLFHMLRDGDPVAAFEHATSAVWCVLSHTADRGGREPMIVAAQQELLTPFRSFRSTPIPAR